PPEPGRVREVLEADHRTDAGADHRVHDLLVAAQRGLVQASRLREQSPPLDREAVSVRAQLLQTFDVAPPQLPRVGTRAGHLRPAVAPPLPVPKIRMDVVALDLIGGRGRAPEE